MFAKSLVALTCKLRQFFPATTTFLALVSAAVISSVEKNND
jgi:hypothetical protein